MPAVSCSWAGIGAAPVSCSPDSVVGSSTRASGFPAAWVISRSATSSGTGAPAASVSSARAASPVSGVSATVGTSSGANVRPSPSRAANTTATRSAPSRREATRTASAVAWSSHCASSMTHSTGASSAASVSTDRVASATRNGCDRDVVRLAERGPQRSGLRRRKPVEDAEDGAQQPVQRGERQRRLGLHALGAQHLHVVAGGRDQVLEQRGLPDAGLPVQQQRPGVPTAGAVQ